MATIEGQYPPVKRVVTGFWSLDRALSNDKELGWPMTITEIFGNQGLGKTTVATSIAGIVANKYKNNIVYAPIEHVDRDYMSSILDSMGFKHTVSMLGGWDMVKKFLPEIKKGKEDIVTDELILDCIIEAMRRDDYSVAILDSLTAISPIEESNSSVADKNMGRRARLSNAMVRGVLQASRFRETPYNLMVIAHKVVEMGGGMKTTTGTDTTGGEGKKNIAKVRVSLRAVPEKTMTELDHNCFILEGKAEKMNFGKPGRKFFLAILGGKGIHHGMTALYDCKRIGIASTGKTIKLGQDSFGSMKTIISKAHDGDDKFFQPFIDALKNPSSIGKVEQESNDGSDWEEDAE